MEQLDYGLGGQSEGLGWDVFPVVGVLVEEGGEAPFCEIPVGVFVTAWSQQD